VICRPGRGLVVSDVGLAASYSPLVRVLFSEHTIIELWLQHRGGAHSLANRCARAAGVIVFIHGWSLQLNVIAGDLAGSQLRCQSTDRVLRGFFGNS